METYFLRWDDHQGCWDGGGVNPGGDQTESEFPSIHFETAKVKLAFQKSGVNKHYWMETCSY